LSGQSRNIDAVIVFAYKNLRLLPQGVIGMRSVTSVVALSAALILGLSGSVALAQDQPAAGSPPPAATTQAPSATRAPNPERQSKMLAKRLSLTPEQESQIEPILADRDQQLQSVRADASLAPRDRRAKVQGIQQDSDSKINAILNDAQKQQYEQMKAEQRAKRQQQREQRQGGAPPADNQ
jgi:periplasmic protein CpxP/Spy